MISHYSKGKEAEPEYLQATQEYEVHGLSGDENFQHGFDALEDRDFDDVDAINHNSVPRVNRYSPNNNVQSPRRPNQRILIGCSSSSSRSSAFGSTAASSKT